MFTYIHIPFCDNKCKYCKFASIGVIQESKIKKYIDKLLLDINSFDKKINRLGSIYFGGGTPSVLNIKHLELIINTLKNKFNFEDNIEITIESTPNKITKSNVKLWKKIGINRLSIGVQTLNNKSLIEIGRGNKGDILDALDNIKTSLQPSPLDDREQDKIIISLDFIIGLPYVKVGEVKNDIKYILDNYDFIKHISVYMLEEYYYPGNWNYISIKDEDYLGEYIEVKRFLEEKGFNRYEISNFAKLGYECKHNKSYWDHSEILAFGLGSHGFIDSKRYNYSDNFSDFYDGKINIEKSLSNYDLFLENVMFGLRTKGLKIKIYQNLNNNKIQEFVNSGYLKIENDILKLEDKGVLVFDYILGEII